MRPSDVGKHLEIGQPPHLAPVSPDLWESDIDLGNRLSTIIVLHQKTVASINIILRTLTAHSSGKTMKMRAYHDVAKQQSHDLL